MYLFKTSGATFNSVIKNEKHAFTSMPGDWAPGELILVSKNKVDCRATEKQIQYTMQLTDIRPLKTGEANLYWPGSEGRWHYLVLCENTRVVNQPFNLEEILGAESRSYGPIMTYRKVSPAHDKIIEAYLKKTGTV